MAFLGAFYFQALMLKAAGWILAGILQMGAAAFDYPAFAGDAFIPISLTAPFAIVAPR
jgi:hypothetical protein